jgi:hypothetical protein
MKAITIPRLVSGLALSLVAFVTVSQLLVVLLLVRAMTDILGLLGYLF